MLCQLSYIHRVPAMRRKSERYQFRAGLSIVDYSLLDAANGVCDTSFREGSISLIDLEPLQ